MNPTPAEAGTRPPRMLRTVTWLTGVNTAFTAMTFVTGPLLARGLGAEGRGTLAAILVPVTFLPALAVLGLPTYAARAAARGRALGPLVGSTALLLLGLGAVVGGLALLAVPTLAKDREVVETWLAVGFLLLPITLLCMLLASICQGLEEWRLFGLARVAAPALVLLGLIALLAAGELTVASAAVLTLAANVLASVPLLKVLRRAAPLRVDGEIVREGVRFGSIAWLGGLASTANIRLDQVLMVPLVPARELGLYVVAFNVANVNGLVVSALVNALNPHVARGRLYLGARALRATLLGVLLANALLCLAMPIALPLLFGGDFQGAVPLAWVLAVAAVPGAGAYVLGQMLTSAGRPGAIALGELVAVAITVPGLLLALPAYGAMGAAVVTLVAYSASFTTLLLFGRLRAKMSVRAMVLPRVGDVAELATVVRRLAAHLPGRRS